MSQNNSALTIGGLVWWGFVLTKIFGHTFAAWSFWWVLLPIVPVVGELVRHFNL